MFNTVDRIRKQIIKDKILFDNVLNEVQSLDGIDCVTEHYKTYSDKLKVNVDIKNLSIAILRNIKLYDFENNEYRYQTINIGKFDIKNKTYYSSNSSFCKVTDDFNEILTNVLPNYLKDKIKINE